MKDRAINDEWFKNVPEGDDDEFGEAMILGEDTVDFGAFDESEEEE